MHIFLPEFKKCHITKTIYHLKNSIFEFGPKGQGIIRTAGLRRPKEPHGEAAKNEGPETGASSRLSMRLTSVSWRGRAIGE